MKFVISAFVIFVFAICTSGCKTNSGSPQPQESYVEDVVQPDCCGVNED